MKKILLISCLFFALAVRSQGILFSNCNAALLSVNPSFAGTTGGARIQSTTVLRNVTQVFRSAQMQTSGDYYFAGAKGGIGCSLAMDKFTTFSQTDLTLNWAQHIELSGTRLKIIPSVITGFRRVSFDPRISSSTPPLPSRVMRTDALLGASVLLEIYERLYVGIVFRDFNVLSDFTQVGGIKNSFTRSFNVSYNLQLSKNDLLQAVVHWRHSQIFNVLQVGSTYLHKNFLMGAGITSGDNTYFQLGYKNSLITASLQSEFITSRLAGNHSPGFALNLAATLRSQHANPAWKSVETW